MKRIKARTGIIVILCIAVFYLIEPSLNKPPVDKGLYFPKPDSTRGMAVGYDFKTGDYKYADTTESTVPRPKIKTHKVKHNTKEVYQMDEDDMEDELDYIGH